METFSARVEALFWFWWNDLITTVETLGWNTQLQKTKRIASNESEIVLSIVFNYLRCKK